MNNSRSPTGYARLIAVPRLAQPGHVLDAVKGEGRAQRRRAQAGHDPSSQLARDSLPSPRWSSMNVAM